MIPNASFFIPPPVYGPEIRVCHIARNFKPVSERRVYCRKVGSWQDFALKFPDCRSLAPGKDYNVIDFAITV
jgi:hypothetical protein